jgi:hypothetical protein
MSSFSRPLSSLSGDHRRFRSMNWNGFGPAPMRSIHGDLRSIRAAQRVTADAIDNSAVLLHVAVKTERNSLRLAEITSKCRNAGKELLLSCSGDPSCSQRLARDCSRERPGQTSKYPRGSNYMDDASPESLAAVRRRKRGSD